ncbi:aldehyde dehydrogenase family protein [Nocardioides sp. CPCC 205120]|uniref:aldehyde dehydrogenase family protein n=1 Tax=Nocardioides sp. CPCC 205120 TaxID=3406462 RepID=UPI003B50234A
MTTTASSPAAPTPAVPSPAVPTSDVPAAQVLADLRRVHAGGRTHERAWRDAQLAGLERLLAEREQEIVAAIAADLGRDGVEAWMGDVASSRAEVLHARRHLRRWMRRRPQAVPLHQQPALAWVQPEPLGVVLVIGPWNYPVYLVLAPLVAALAAGNCAVVKPSELAPVSSALLAELLPQYVDPEAVRVVQGDATTSQDLIASGFDHVLFTGGTEVGRKIMEAAAPTLTPVTLELGGKSPVVVTASADLEVTARRIAWFKLVNSGQTCIAPDYVLVDAGVRDRFVDLLVGAVRDLRRDKAGAGLPIVNDRQLTRLAAYLRSTTGRVALGGGVDEAARTIEPTVVVDPDPEDELMREEIFGPLLPVLTYRTLDEAISFVNARPKPLAFYAFTSSAPDRRRLVREVPAGGTVVNHVGMHSLVPQLPFGGVGASGTGAYHGRWGFDALSHRKAVLSRTTRLDPSFVYPPYSPRAVRLIKRVL